MSAKKQTGEPTFEQELERLETLAERMENGDLPLEELMAAYEEGMRIAKNLNQRLDAARARLSEVKAGKGGEPVVAPSALAEQASLLDGLEP